MSTELLGYHLGLIKEELAQEPSELSLEHLELFERFCLSTRGKLPEEMASGRADILSHIKKAQSRFIKWQKQYRPSLTSKMLVYRTYLY